jgi:hypothetical protein
MLRHAHHEGRDNVVEVMAERQLVTLVLATEVHQLRAPISGAVDAGHPALHVGLSDVVLDEDEWDASSTCELVEIVEIDGVRQIRELDVGAHDLELAGLRVAKLTEEIDSCKRILAAGETDQDPITLLNQLELLAGPVEQPLELVVELRLRHRKVESPSMI